MHTERQRELINNLIAEVRELSYSSESSEELKSFINKGEVILKRVFPNNPSHAEKFSKVSFSPSVVALGGDTTPTYVRAFERGKQSVIGILNGALTEIDLTAELFATEISAIDSLSPKQNTSHAKKSKVFIVHGHDDALKTEVARFIEKLGFEAVILHEQANEGRTIIEKIEKHSDVGFAIVLYTPCDEGKAKTSESLKARARQNVVFEHGFFIAKLGRKNVVALHKGEGIELPNDISGVVYVKYEDGIWKTQIADEMDASGYEINYRLVR